MIDGAALIGGGDVQAAVAGLNDGRVRVFARAGFQVPMRPDPLCRA